MAEPQGSQDGSGSGAATAGGGPVDLASRLESLLTYPSLGRLVEGDDPAALNEMRNRLTQSQRGFERVVRQGRPQDAAQAARVARAYTLALGLLAELETAKGKN